MKTADLYIRVSTDGQADKGYSRRRQEELLTRYCDINNITKVCGIFVQASLGHKVKSFRFGERKMLQCYITRMGYCTTLSYCQTCTTFKDLMKKSAIFIGCPAVTLSASDSDNSSSAPTRDFPQGIEWVPETVAISPPVYAPVVFTASCGEKNS